MNMRKIEKSVRSVYPDARRKGVFELAHSMFRTGANDGLWSRMVIRSFLVAPYQALNFAFKEQYRRIFSPYDPVTAPGKALAGNLMSGGASGFTCCILSFPLDIVKEKTRLDLFRKEKKYRGIFDCARKVAAEEGVTALFRGVGLLAAAMSVYRAL